MTTVTVGTATQDQRLQNSTAIFKTAMKAVEWGLRVAMPGIIQTFDSASLTVTVDIPIPDKVRLNDKLQDVQPVTLLDVPLVLPHTANFALTMAPQAGDECLLIFADYCINTWWEKGADKVSDQYTSSPQPVIRRHDMSDGFAILAPWSQPKAKTLANYSSNQAQLRTTDGTIYVGVGSSGISLNGELTLSGTPVAATYANIEASLPIKIGSTTYYIKLSTSP